MQNFFSTLIVFSLCLITASSLQAQNSWVPAAYQYLQDRDDSFDLKVSDFTTPVVTDEYTSRGINYTYYNQQWNGVPIFGKSLTVASTDEELRYASHNYISIEEYEKVEFPESIDPNKILSELAPIAGFSFNNDFEQVETKSEFNIRGFSSISPEKIFIEKAYVERGNQLQPAWLVGVFHNDISKWWQYQINANTGELIDKISWTIECEFEHHCHDDHTIESHYKPMIAGEAKTHKVAAPGQMMANTYEVFAAPLFSPLYGDRTVETTPWSPALNASPFGWHDDDGVAGAEYTVTRGNNVRAVEDADANNSGGYSPDGGASLDFQFPFDPNDDPVDYQDAAIVNLFYWNNLMHDIFYQYGFDEASGNFQENNYGNGGNGSDMVNADAQDGSGTNNANFSTPPDGSNPRMQMFIWNVGATTSFEVTSPASIAGLYSTSSANFGPTTGTYSGELVEAIPALACTSITNGADIDGNIALIDRGDCTFVSKVNEAQDAGAIAVIVCNNVAGGTITMGGTDPGITIPSMMLSLADCNTIKAEMPGVEVEFSYGGSTQLDSDMDNSVIAHEYGHGISIRLTGGPSTSSCLTGSEQMGEGWSDYVGLITSIEPGDDGLVGKGVGSYLVGEAPTANGIRTYPYSTDLNVNAHTYDDIKTESVPHGVGTVWAAMLWEMSWELINEHGFDPDLYTGTGGNNIAMNLVIEGLKLQPCAPGFVDGRDAILAADDILYGGANKCLIWNAFAKRGLGFSALQGSSSSRSDGTEAFDLPFECDGEIVVTKTGAGNASIGDSFNYVIEATNSTPGILTGIEIIDELPSELDYVAGSLSSGTESNGTITFSQTNLNVNGTASINFDVTINNTASVSNLNTYEDFEYDYSEWLVTSGQGTNAWGFSNSNPYRGTGDFFVPNTTNQNSQYLTIENLSLSADPLFSFYHYYNTELNKDGGMVEISTNGGATWKDLGSAMYQNGYNGTLENGSNNDIDDRDAFTGFSGAYTRTMIDLSEYANMTADIRFFFGSNNSIGDDGWYIDDIMLYDGEVILNEACASSNENFSGCGNQRTFVLPACELYNRYFTDTDNDGYGDNSSETISCTPSGAQVLAGGDCDDSDPSINPGASEICDGVDQNCNGEIDEDCNGSVVCLVEDDEDLEAGWGMWIDGGLDCLRTINDASFANSGVYCARLRDNTASSNVSSSDLNLAAYETVQIDVSFITIGYSSGDKFHIEYSDNGGATWSSVAEYNYLADIVNNQRYNESILINGPFTSNARFRFRNDAPSNSRRVYVDDFYIEGCDNDAGTETCTDGIQNGNETGIDCGGPDCPECPTASNCSELDNESFELGFGMWVDGGSDCIRSSADAQYANTGAWCIRLRDNTASSTMTSAAFDFSNYESIDVSLSYISVGLATGDAFHLELSSDNGVTWTSLKTWNFNLDFTNNVRGDEVISAMAPFTADTKIRVRCDANANSDRIYVDDVIIEGCSSAGASCSDGIMNGSETGVDCGGPDCTPCTSCNDGIMNGSETGVDCGGPDCTPCTSCNDGIMNGNETGVDCGGPDCPACPTCDDGIMNGNETGIDCGGPDCPACPTCDDGIMNGNETGVDCGGSDCEACPSGNACNELDNEGFEAGYGMWNDGGSDCVRSSNDTQYANTGNFCIRLRDNTASSVMFSDVMDYSIYESITIDFSFITVNLNAGHTFHIELSDNAGTTWTTLETWEYIVDIDNNQRYNVSIPQNGPFTANTMIRFRADLDANSDRVYIDDVVIEGCDDDALTSEEEFDALIDQPETGSNLISTDVLSYRIYPNPNNGQFNLVFENENIESNIKILSLDGSVIYDENVSGKSHEMILNQLQSGMYLCIVNNGKEQITKKFIVR